MLNLGEWDEQFHALVAKNMLHDPLKPVLINDDLVELDPNDWSLCHTWLSKPPLTFWFIAVSMKIFGVNEFGLRLPSLIFSLITIYIVFLIGKRLYNEKTGLITAFFYAINGLLYEINVGQLSGDHVDTLFHLIFHLSVYWIIVKKDIPVHKLGSLLGILIGFAFLTKWVMAFFILFVCVSYYAYVHHSFQKALTFICYLMLTFLLVATPWMLWIYHNFPLEAEMMMKGIVMPVATVVQNHGGPYYYYLNSIRININELIYLPLIFFFFKTCKRMNEQRFLSMVWILIPLMLLSVSSTKREVYIMMSATPLFMIISVFILYLNQFKRHYKKTVYFIQVLFLVTAVRYGVERIKPWKPRLQKPEYRKEMENLLIKYSLPADSMVIVNEPHFIEARFYYGLLGYRYLSDSILHSIRLKGYKVYNNEGGRYVKIE